MAATSPAAKRQILKRLRNLGSHKYNSEILKKGEGNLMVVYRPKSESETGDYVPCSECAGYYKRRQLWKHAKKCKGEQQGQRKRHVADGELLLPVPVEVSGILLKVIQGMTNDSVTRCVKQDELILKIGEKMCMKQGHNTENFNNIRHCLRILGRLLIILQQTKHQVLRMENFLHPTLYKTIVSAARQLAGYDSSTNKYSSPSLALKVGHYLKRCCNLLKGEALQAQDSLKASQVDQFKTLLELNWESDVSANALRTLSEAKMNNIYLLPLTKDVKAFSDYLKDEIDGAISKMERNPEGRQDYISLQKSLLALIILFNRRRSGEASRMAVSDYEKSLQCASMNDNDIELSPMEKMIAKRLHRVEIIGKKGRKVPILLTEKMYKAIRLIIQNRAAVGIHQANAYVFACMNGAGYLRGSDVLRVFSEQCGAEHPETLRSTRLRKHIATLTQVMNLKENDLDILANFMGHDIRVHREFYRLPEHILQTAKISKLFLAADNSQLQSFSGKSLDDIEVAADETVPGKPYNQFE
jgi:hypothetical protein